MGQYGHSPGKVLFPRRNTSQSSSPSRRKLIPDSSSPLSATALVALGSDSMQIARFSFHARLNWLYCDQGLLNSLFGLLLVRKVGQHVVRCEPFMVDLFLF